MQKRSLDIEDSHVGLYVHTFQLLKHLNYLHEMLHDNYVLSTPRSGHLSFGSDKVHFVPQGLTGRVLKISPITEFDPRYYQPVARRCTYYAIPIHN